jgi:protein-disulfide isomerase
MRAALIALAAVVVAGAAAVPLIAVQSAQEPAIAAEAPPLDKSAVEKIVRDYLIANPEVLQEAYAALETKQRAAEEQKQTAAIADQKGRIFDSARQVVLGNPKGAVTMVEFFDYNCGYCKRALGDMVKMIKDNPDLRVVLKEFPVLGRGSSEAAQVAIAVNKVAPDRYLEFHQKLLGGEGPADRAAALAVVAELGLPTDKINAAMESPEVAQTIEEVYGLASALGITGTPSYVIGDKVLVGAVGLDTLADRVTTVRNCNGSATC